MDDDDDIVKMIITLILEIIILLLEFAVGLGFFIFACGCWVMVGWADDES